ncbi:MAG: GHKL domain-containing protein [Bdellovibrionales bacterium]|nr:GHKL domain-containing protein [Bdellovibrionales bacterium]
MQLNKPKFQYSLRISRVLVVLLLTIAFGVHWINHRSYLELENVQNSSIPLLENTYQLQQKAVTFYSSNESNKESWSDLQKDLKFIEDTIPSSDGHDFSSPLASLKSHLSSTQMTPTDLRAMIEAFSELRHHLSLQRETKIQSLVSFQNISLICTLMLLSIIFFVRYTLVSELHENVQKGKTVIQELETQKRKTESAARLASIGEMAGGIAHEINNPLAIIKGYSEIIQLQVKSESPDLEQIDSLINNILKTTDRISKIVQGLRKLSRKSDDDPFQLTPIKNVIQEALDLSQEKLKSNGFQFHLNIESSASIMCNPVELSQVLINLINNAYDATEGQLERWIEISTSEDHKNNQVKITLKDSGYGIPAELQEKIFQPYFTTKASGKGTGLGLSISKAIIEKHGGIFQLDETCKHTCFSLIFPTATEEAHTKIQKAA